jgi:hypothetical protein
MNRSSGAGVRRLYDVATPWLEFTTDHLDLPAGSPPTCGMPIQAGHMMYPPALTAARLAALYPQQAEKP